VNGRFLLLLGCLLSSPLAACDPSPLPIDLEVKDHGVAASGVPGTTSELELIAKTQPGAEIHFEGQTKNLGDHASESFTIPKARLKIGKNTFTVDGTAGALFSKKAGTASVTWDAGIRGLLRIGPQPAASGRAGEAVPDSSGALPCTSAVCAKPSLRLTTRGTLPLQIDSAIAATVTIGDAKTTAGPGETGKLEVDLRTRMGDLVAYAEPKIPLEVAMLADGQRAAETIDLGGAAVADFIADAFMHVEEGPVTFAGETPTAPGTPPLWLVVVGVPGRKVILVSAPASAASPTLPHYKAIDLVAVAHKTERVFGCGGGTEILYADLDVRVFERRTAKPVAAKLLRADRIPCPPASGPGAVAAGTKLEGVVREDDMKKVLGEVLRGP
jgi:hypothetical protein